MLATAVVQEIDRLLKMGQLSHRKIAARLGVSRGTVSAIASGRRGLHGRDSFDAGCGARRAGLPPTRCPGCGYRVYEPCLICRARSRQERQKIRQLLASPKPNGCD
jgi:hypothetical protein